MAFNDCQNRELVAYAQDKLGLNPITDVLPRAVIPTIQPTFEMNRNVISVVRTSAAAETIYTVPSDRDFFLTNVNINIAINALTAIATNDLDCTLEDGTAITFSAVASASPSGSLTNDTFTIAFPHAGVKLKRGSTIVSTLGGDAGTFVIAGYVEKIGNDRST